MNSYRWAALLFFAFALYPYMSGEFAVSVVPGWHTVIYPPLAIAGMAASLCMLLLAAGYLLMNNSKPLSNKSIYIHAAASTAPILFLQAMHNYFVPVDLDTAMFSWLSGMVCYLMFAIAQLIFIGLVVVKFRKNKPAADI